VRRADSAARDTCPDRAGPRPRRSSKRVWVGGTPIGDGAPISVQSMCTTLTHDVDATIRQIEQLQEAGCEIARVAGPDKRAGEALKEVVRRSILPVVADIHFDWKLALMALEARVHKLRLNPGNIHDKQGVREVVRSPMLLPVLLLATAVGVLFIGPFMVVSPILVRDYYGGDVAQLAMLSTAFPLGTILGSVAILWRGRIRRKGAAQLISLVAGSGCLGMVSLGLPFWGTLAAICAWGMGSAVFANAGRTVFQEQARPSHRARVLSVYMLGFMGTAGLIGAPLSGVLVEHVGPLATCAVASGAMVVVAAFAFLFTGVAQME
jgi:hypothetical protein